MFSQDCCEILNNICFRKNENMVQFLKLAFMLTMFLKVAIAYFKNKLLECMDKFM